MVTCRAYAGVNASDVNYTAGRYFGGGAAAEARLPFDAGFESVGVVAAVGPGVSGALRVCLHLHRPFSSAAVWRVSFLTSLALRLLTLHP